MSTSPTPHRLGQAILAVAMTMPCLHMAHAENMPERGVMSYRYLNYRDSQPGEDRVSVKAHSFMLMTPFAEQWSFQASATVDTVSGASPPIWTSISGASMHDQRTAEDISVTRYFGSDTATLGTSLSEENDYTSKGLSFTGTHNSEDRNTTYSYGIGLSRDRIDDAGKNENKRSAEYMLGLTQVITSKDIAQITISHTDGRGVFNDHYKISDNRPRERQQSRVLARWNHFFEDTESTLRLSYRYYSDSWNIQAHTVTAELVQPLANGWILTPLLRLHDQSAARFFVSPGATPSDLPYLSFDQRLSAYGARSIGLKVAKTLNTDWSADLSYEHYEQRGSWHLLGSGSTGLETFRAEFFQFGLSRKF